MLPSGDATASLAAATVENCAGGERTAAAGDWEVTEGEEEEEGVLSAGFGDAVAKGFNDGVAGLAAAPAARRTGD